MNFDNYILGHYTVKPKNKFPYIIHISLDSSSFHPSWSESWNNFNKWLTENFGRYNEAWHTNGNTENGLYPYAFKNEEDLLAFKLLWG